MQREPDGFESVAPQSPWSSTGIFSLHLDKSVSDFGHLVNYYRLFG